VCFPKHAMGGVHGKGAAGDEGAPQAGQIFGLHKVALHHGVVGEGFADGLKAGAGEGAEGGSGGEEEGEEGEEAAHVG